MKYCDDNKINSFIEKISQKTQVYIEKSNADLPECWNETTCQISIDDPHGGYLIVNIETKDGSFKTVQGTITGAVYYTTGGVKIPISEFDFNGKKEVVLIFRDELEGVMQN